MKKNLVILAVLCMLLMAIPTMTFADSDIPEGAQLAATLYAGQTDPVGSVYAWNDAENLYVVYQLNDEAIEDGWLITEVHLGAAVDEFPWISKGGNPAPGQFPFKDSFADGVESYKICIPFSGIDGYEPGDELIIAAHAVVSRTLPCEEENVVYGTARNTGKVFEINPNTGIATELFQTGLPATNVSPNGLAYDSDNDCFYYVKYPGAAVLYANDELGERSVGQLLHEIACADFYDGKYYYIAGGPAGSSDDLYEVIFSASNEIEAVNPYPDIAGGDHAWTFNGDIAISPDGLIYGQGLDSKTGKYQFFSVQRDGSEWTLINDTYTKSLQLAFSTDGKLYGHDAKYGYFYEVDLISGDLTELSNCDVLFTDMASGKYCEPEIVNETAWAADENNLRFCDKKSWATYFTLIP